MQIKIDSFPFGPEIPPATGEAVVAFLVETTDQGQTKQTSVIIRNVKEEGFTVEPRRYDHRFIDSFRLFSDALEAAEQAAFALAADASRPWRKDVRGGLTVEQNEAFPCIADGRKLDGSSAPR